MFDNSSKSITRRGVLGAFAATTLIAAPTFSKAAGLLRGAGDIRRIKMTSPRTGESIDTIYWLEGKYIKDAKAMDLNTVDILAASHNLLDATEPYMLLSGYRSPKTNAMLRRRSRGVARNSLHMKGEAADIRLTSRSVNQLFRAAVTCKGGGVGKYSRSNFVHMDSGVVRSWGA